MKAEERLSLVTHSVIKTNPGMCFSVVVRSDSRRSCDETISDEDEEPHLSQQKPVSELIVKKAPRMGSGFGDGVCCNVYGNACCDADRTTPLPIRSIRAKLSSARGKPTQANP